MRLAPSPVKNGTLAQESRFSHRDGDELSPPRAIGNRAAPASSEEPAAEFADVGRQSGAGSIQRTPAG
jgi:hypothetical protein